MILIYPVRKRKLVIQVAEYTNSFLSSVTATCSTESNYHKHQQISSVVIVDRSFDFVYILKIILCQFIFSVSTKIILCHHKFVLHFQPVLVLSRVSRMALWWMSSLNPAQFE